MRHNTAPTSSPIPRSLKQYLSACRKATRPSRPDLDQRSRCWMPEIIIESTSRPCALAAGQMPQVDLTRGGERSMDIAIRSGELGYIKAGRTSSTSSCARGRLAPTRRTMSGDILEAPALPAEAGGSSCRRIKLAGVASPADPWLSWSGCGSSSMPRLGDGSCSAAVTLHPARDREQFPGGFRRDADPAVRDPGQAPTGSGRVWGWASSAPC